MYYVVGRKHKYLEFRIAFASRIDYNDREKMTVVRYWM